MCELYPRYGSCCGIPSRIAFIFIAILSIVTGALINAVLKKAGVKPSAIHQELDKLKKISHGNFKFEETDDEILFSATTADISSFQDVETTSRKARRTRSRKTTSDEPYSTVEIIGEDGQHEIIRFVNDDDVDEKDPFLNPEIQAQVNRNRRDHDPTSSGRRVLKKKKSSAKPTTIDSPAKPTTTESSDKLTTATAKLTTNESSATDFSKESSAILTTTESSEEEHMTKAGTVRPLQREFDAYDAQYNPQVIQQPIIPAPGPKNKIEKIKIKREASFIRTMNLTGVNFLGMVFIALGLLLLVANFMNSPDLMLVYVFLCVPKCIMMLGLLISVVADCAKDHDVCLLHQLDWFTSFILTLFWFLYSFIWAFFAAVANGYANVGWGNTL